MILSTTAETENGAEKVICFVKMLKNNWNTLLK